MYSSSSFSHWQVTRHNFVQTLPLVREALTECKFFAFDCEMTGLFVKSNGNNNGSNKPPAFLDDIEDRYEEVRPEISKLLFINTARRFFLLHFFKFLLS